MTLKLKIQSVVPVQPVDVGSLYNLGYFSVEQLAALDITAAKSGITAQFTSALVDDIKKAGIKCSRSPEVWGEYYENTLQHNLILAGKIELSDYPYPVLVAFYQLANYFYQNYSEPEDYTAHILKLKQVISEVALNGNSTEKESETILSEAFRQTARSIYSNFSSQSVDADYETFKAAADNLELQELYSEMYRFEAAFLEILARAPELMVKVERELKEIARQLAPFITTLLEDMEKKGISASSKATLAFDYVNFSNRYGIQV